jgi:electron transfer flavoprotein alpha subunit
MPEVWAWVQADPEVMGDAAELAEALGVPAVAVAAGGEPEALAAAGASRVLTLAAPYDAEVHAAAIAGALPQPPAALLLPGTGDGSDLAPRLAGLLGAACLLDCAWLRPGLSGPQPAGPEGVALVAGRWAHDDRALERWEVPAGTPLVATMRPGSRGSPRPRTRPLQVEELTAPSRPPRVRHLRRRPADPGSVELTDAERIVAAGLGIGSAERLGEVRALADRLGAALGASRPLADRGWVAFERQIGTTGQRVSPRLYMALGISGAAQHLGGLRQVETLVAVNIDPACPMMARATLAAVGDATEVVAALLRRLEVGPG